MDLECTAEKPIRDLVGSQVSISIGTFESSIDAYRLFIMEDAIGQPLVVLFLHGECGSFGCPGI